MASDRCVSHPKMRRGGISVSRWPSGTLTFSTLFLLLPGDSFSIFCGAPAIYVGMRGFSDPLVVFDQTFGSVEIIRILLKGSIQQAERRSEERRVGKECRSRWSP